MGRLDARTHRGMKQVSCSDPAEHTLRIVASGEREDPPYEMAQSQPSLPLDGLSIGSQIFGRRSPGLGGQILQAE